MGRPDEIRAPNVREGLAPLDLAKAFGLVVR
jgi:hypothetical protein